MQQTSLVVYVGAFVAALAGGVMWQTGNTSLLGVFCESCQNSARSPNSAITWPPSSGETYPDVQLTGLDGQPVHLSRYRGKVLIIESIGMPCEACQAFSGGHKHGGFGGLQPQPNLKSFEQCLSDYANGTSLSDNRLLYIQVLYYGPSARHLPTLEQARQWARHFQLTSLPNTVVLLATHDLLSSETRHMIPNFHLIDHNFVLRCDAGNPPRQDLYRELLPMVPQLLNEVQR